MMRFIAAESFWGSFFNFSNSIFIRFHPKVSFKLAVGMDWKNFVRIRNYRKIYI